MIPLTIKILIAYLLGSLSGSLILGKFRHIDIRKMGSGNAGGTNALRAVGFWFAVAVLVVDLGKGSLAVALIPRITILNDTLLSPLALQCACGMAAILGHMYPLYFGFRGGKGVATFAGVMLVLAPLAVGGAIAVLFITLLISGYVGLGSILAAASSVVFVWFLHPAPALLIFCAVAAVMIVFAHRENIARMIQGTEHRFERVRVVNWFK